MLDTSFSHLDVSRTRSAPSMVGSEPQEGVLFRGFQEGDIPACARLAEEAWPAGMDDGVEVIEHYGMEEYMEYALGLSNYAEIAYCPEGMVGFLFGRIDGLPWTERPRKSTLGEVPGILRSLFAHRRLSLNMISFVWSLLLSETKLKLRRPKSDASVEMFIVGSAHRGKGVGSELMNRFLKIAKDSGSKLVTLYTDNRMSNWQFYESRGFKRVGTFYDNMTSHYAGVYTEGIIYALELGENVVRQQVSEPVTRERCASIIRAKPDLHGQKKEKGV